MKGEASSVKDLRTVIYGIALVFRTERRGWAGEDKGAVASYGFKVESVGVKRKFGGSEFTTDYRLRCTYETTMGVVPA